MWQVGPDLKSALTVVGSSHEDLKTVESSVYYPNCAAARAAGVAPLHRGEPGYRQGLDGDSDGKACEPYYDY